MNVTNVRPSAVWTGHENWELLQAFAGPGPDPSQNDAAPLISVGVDHVLPPSWVIDE
jgi:hypothetical protein